MSRTLAFLLAVFAGSAALARSQAIADLECEVKKAALTFGAKRITKNVASLERGLNFADNCTHSVPEAGAVPEFAQLPDGAVVFYVATSGDDTNPGTQEKPFRSLAQARDAIRFYKRQLANESLWLGATVSIAEGKYYMRRPLHLSIEDSGEPNAPVIYQAAEGAQVTLSAGTPLALDWQKSPGNANIYTAKVPEGTEFTSLFVNGVRQVRARYPDGDPQEMSGVCYSKTQDDSEGCPGYAQARGGLARDAGLKRAFAREQRGKPTHRVRKSSKSTTSSSSSSPSAGASSQVSISVGSPERPHTVTGDDHFATFHYITDVGRVGVPGFGPVFSFWNNPYTSRATGLKFDPKVFNKTWAHPETGVVHMFHGGLWGNWMFQMASRDDEKSELHFAFGGWQEARGGGVSSNHFYVENVLEELDVPGEWFLDTASSTLYLYPNASSCPDLSKAEVSAPRHATLVRVQGTGARPVHDVELRGLTLTETRTTFLDYYEVPSGGDWSIHRGGAVFLEGVERCAVVNCTFAAVGGNAVFLSEHVRNCTVAHNEVALSGDSAVAAVGRTGMLDGMQPSYPARNLIANNHVHDFGMYGKQVSCYFQALACGNTLRDNVCYNGPRAGINFNDGFGGDTLVQGNLVFNMVRETGDHGPFNSWDRQPYLAPSRCTDGPPSIVPAANTIARNFIVNGYSGVWALDHDDGSAYYNDTLNFLVFGGLKNYLGHDKMSGPGNVVVYPGVAARSKGARRCQTDDNGEFADQYYYGNRCFTPDGDFYTFSRCDPAQLAAHVYQTRDNRHYAPGAAFSQLCGARRYDFAAWQAAGQDANSTVAELPAPVDIVAMGMDAVGN